MVFVAAGLLLIIVIGTLSFPFWHREEAPLLLGPEATQDQERIDLELEREIILASLAELEVDRAQEKLLPEDYERLKATDERRLLQILTRLDASAHAAPTPTAPPRAAVLPRPQATMHWAGSTLIILFVIGSASGVYAYLFSKQTERAAAVQQQMGQGMPDPREMVARLEAKLRQNPNDLQGQIMAGRSYMALERTEDARNAWTKVLELDPKNAEAHFNLGVILITTRKIDDPKLFQEALGHFDTAFVKVPQEPSLLWYRGVAQVHLQRYADADQSWTAAYQNLDPGSEDAKFVRQALEQLRAGKPPLF